jgi:alpha-L-fucosidase 2
MTSNFYVFVSNTPFTSYDLTATINQAGVINYHVPGYSGTPGAINVKVDNETRLD